jgi:HEAT repeat protein
MQGPVHNLAALAVCCCLVAVSGCAQTAESVAGFVSKPFAKKSPDVDLNIKTPDDRMKELKEMAKTAKKKTPPEQERIVADLTQEIQAEPDPRMRRQILRTLTECPQPAAAAVIVAGLSDGDMETRRMACTCLGKRGGKEAVQELTRMISSDTNFDVRIAAVRALGQAHDPGALAPLAEALADADPAMQYWALESLTAVSGRNYGNNVQAWRDYAASGKTDAPEASFAERFNRAWY